MIDIYEMLKSYEPLRKERVEARKMRPGDEFKPHAALAKALKNGFGWTLRDVIDCLYREVLAHVPEAQRINNHKLTRKLYEWRAQGVFTDDDVSAQIALLEQKLGARVGAQEGKTEMSGGINIMSTGIGQEHSVLDFLKYYEKLNGTIEEDTRRALIEFYKNNKELNLDGIMLKWSKGGGNV